MKDNFETKSNTVSIALMHKFEKMFKDPRYNVKKTAEWKEKHQKLY